MKKFIFALCFNHLVYADGFTDLKQIQDRFYQHIYRAGSAHVAPTSAPEVAYIAGLLRLQPVTLRGSDEANAIYMSLINRGGSGNVGISRCDYPSNAQASAAFNASDFSALTRYNKYCETGHSVLGVAAQEKVVLRFAAPPPAAAAPAAAAPAAAPGIGGLLSGFGGFKSTGIKPPEGGAVAAAPAPAAVPLLVKVQQKIAELTIKDPKTKDENTDLTLLQELEQKLGAPAAAGTSAEDAARLEKLKALFDSMSIADSTARGMAMGQLRMGLKVGGSAAPAAAAKKDPVEAAIELCVRGESELTLVPTKITDNKAAVKEAIRQLNEKVASGIATNNQIKNLRVLERRLPQIPEEDDDDDSDGEDGISHHGSVAAYVPASNPASPVAVVNIPSMPLSPVPAQAVATAAPAFNPTVAAAAPPVIVKSSSSSSPKPTGGYVAGAFKGFSPKPSVVSGVGGSAKKAVAVAPPPSPMPVISSSSASATAAPAAVADGAAPTSSLASVAVGGGAASEIPVDANGVKTYLSALHSQLGGRDYGGGSREDQIAYLEKLLVKLSAIETSIIRGGSIEMAMNARGEASAEIKKARDQINPALRKLRDGR
ncbi:MAG: hypothetical protein WCJ92_02620 [Alphaproteobacteria bacterium]